MDDAARADGAGSDTAINGPGARSVARIALLTGADDRSYALGLATSLMERGIHVEFIGSDQIDGPELHGTHMATFHNLRGDQSTSSGLARKVLRLLAYYARLLVFAATARPRLFHILWNNKFELFDRTLLMLYYRFCRRKLVLTAHNVNAAKRDGRDSALNRLTLRIQYGLCERIFVHTERMRHEMMVDFDVDADKITVIPFGINNATPVTSLSPSDARRRLGLDAGDHVLLFFGQIAPYKGLEYLVAALPKALSGDARLRLVIAGKVKAGCDEYWHPIETSLTELSGRVQARIEHIPDHEIEVYFKAADVLVVPYVHIFQSGVPFLAYSFGLPVIATDVGGLRDDIVEGRTGYLCRARDPADLARAIGEFFVGSLRVEPERTRRDITAHANERYSWGRVAAITESAYACALLSTTAPSSGP